MQKKLILGSSSAPRQRLMQRLKVPFQVCIPDIDETPLPHETANTLVLRLAEAKARKIAQANPKAVIIAADEVGILNKQILCKPLNHAAAVSQLLEMSGKKIDFYTGLCVLDSEDDHLQTSLEIFSVTFRKLNLAMIEGYLQKEDALACAGSFRAEGLGIALVKELHHTDFSALIGLPLIPLIAMLENVGISPFY